MLSTLRRSSRLRATAGALIACALLTACGPAAADDGVAAEVPPAPTTPAAPAWLTQDVDWKSLAYEAADCLSREEWIDSGQAGVQTWDEAEVNTVTGDVTGEGGIATAVEAYCPTPTSSLSGWVAVFHHGEDGPELLGVLADLFFRDPTVTIDAGTVTVEGSARGDDDPMCCASQWGRAVYEWDGDSLELVQSLQVPTTQPVSGEVLADGSYAGIIRGIQGRTVLIDVIEWFEDDAATQACIADGNGEALAGPQAWCHEYYMRNNNDLVRELRLGDNATVTYIDWEGTGGDVRQPVRASIDTIVSSPDYERFFAFTVEDGVVTEFPEEHFVS